MKLYRQDGSEVELNEREAQVWLVKGLATFDKKVPVEESVAPLKVPPKQKE